MLKCASVFTYEIDDPEIALAEINAQLDEKITLLEHTVGIVMCHADYIGSGVIRHLANNLPFELVGVTTSSQAVNGEAGELMLTIFVMTAADVRFVTGVTGDLDEAIDAPLAEALGAFTELPKLALVFPPLILKYAGDAYVDAWRRLIPGVPIFGPITIDDTLNFEESVTIYRGESHQTAMPFVLCYGNIKPRFIVGTLPETNPMPYKGEVTKSSGPYVQEINNINAYKYFEEIGFVNDSPLSENYLFVPFVFEPKKREDYDGIPIIRGRASFTEDGTAIFRGDVDEGSTFTMLSCDANDVLSNTRQKIGQINRMADAGGADEVNGVLLFPCVVRRMMTMHAGPLVELEAARDAMRPDIPFMMGYAGGEICPTSVAGGIPVNRFHNYALIILVV